jgi:hypothetical protein
LEEINNNDISDSANERKRELINRINGLKIQIDLVENEKISNETIEYLRNLPCDNFERPKLTDEQKDLLKKMIPYWDLRERYES